jgi:hypothetical protein
MNPKIGDQMSNLGWKSRKNPEIHVGNDGLEHVRMCLSIEPKIEQFGTDM